MDVNDFVGQSKMKTGTGVDIAFNATISGGAYMPSMLRVDGYDVKDWAPVFDPVAPKFNMTIGYRATVLKDLENTIAIGTNVVPTESNVVQVGNHSQQFLTLREPAFRLDEKDMANISDVDMGLDFIDALKPIKYQPQYREKYLDEQYPLPHPIVEPENPDRNVYKIEEADGTMVIDEPSYQAALAEYESKMVVYEQYRIKLEETLVNRKNAMNSPQGSPESGFYFGFKPSNILEAATDGDFNPLTNDPNSGKPVNYHASQMLPPMVKAIQEEHILIKQLRIEVDEHGVMLGVLAEDVADAKESVNKLETETLPGITERLDSLEAASEGDGEEEGGGTDHSAEIQQINQKLGDHEGRIEYLERNGGGGGGEPTDPDNPGTGGGGDIVINRPIILSSENPVYYNIVNGETSRVHELLNFIPNVGIQFGTAVNITIHGTRIDLKGWQVDLWSGDQVIKHLGSDFSPLRPDGRPRSTALGSDRSGEFYRWQTLFAISETNIFSDMRLKTEKLPLEEREKKAALEIKDTIGLYKLLSSVEEKGDEARYHVGVYAQEVVSILEKYELDPLNRYAFIGKDRYKESGEEGYYNIRVAELALFIIAAM